MQRPRFACSGVIIADAAPILANDPADAAAFVPGVRETLALFAQLFDDILLVTIHPTMLLEHDAFIVSPHRAPYGIWSYVHAGLFAARNSHAFVTTCEGPHLSAAGIHLFLDAIEPRYDAIGPAGPNAAGTLASVYAKICLKPLWRQLLTGDPHGSTWLRQIRVQTIGAQGTPQAMP